MRKTLMVLALVAAALAPTVALAEPSAKALALTKRMVAAMHVDETMAPIMRSMTRQQFEGVVAQQKGLNDQQKAALSRAVAETMEESLNDGLMQKVMDKLIPAYAEVYTEQELQALVDFYESPIGQSVLRKMPQLGLVAGKAMGEIMPGMMADMTARMSKKLEGFDKLGK
ncbi:DUF2059 domain-containing protein [Caulobacter segnis]|uniref:DUF2059 domain-containing protein n=1 Tax=Caulobacter segnis TaxID=88688 RepID=A0A2W5VLI2_9CAUL|nr:DUF2059 domain-containing protein [Caulobacter segnis]PZR36205.1 MAG: hypothetical protein DI526_04420 [Caulobacter segnis]